jgi:hypothetical protein
MRANIFQFENIIKNQIDKMVFDFSIYNEADKESQVLYDDLMSIYTKLEEYQTELDGYIESKSVEFFHGMSPVDIEVKPGYEKIARKLIERITSNKEVALKNQDQLKKRIAIYTDEVLQSMNENKGNKQQIDELSDNLKETISLKSALSLDFNKFYSGDFSNPLGIDWF